jgi:hypothetical protein
MAATWRWHGQYGSSPGTSADLNTGGNEFNFKDLDSLTSEADYTSNPITAGNNSYEVWIHGNWSGTMNEVSNLQFWKSAGGPDSGISLYWEGEQTVYVTPIKTNSTIATATVPTADPGTANVSITGALAGKLLTAGGDSDYIVLQMRSTTAAAAGDTSTYTFTLQYDES